ECVRSHLPWIRLSGEVRLTGGVSRYGDGEGGCVHLNLLRCTERARYGLHILLRIRRTKAPMASADAETRGYWSLWINRTRGWFSGGWRSNHNLQAPGRQVDTEWPEEDRKSVV